MNENTSKQEAAGRVDAAAKAVKYEQIGVAVTCRSYEEYVRMFALDDRKIAEAGELLDVAGGAASFAADAAARGLRAYAADPRYAKPPETLIGEAHVEIETSTAKLEKLKDDYDFSFYGDLAGHRARREASLDRFAADYRSDYALRSDAEADGLDARRYVAASLPKLPFADGRFGLVLCSHFLFLYAEQFDYDFHERSVLELIRVCRTGGEVRIYPVVSLGYEVYPYLDRLIAAVSEAGCIARMAESRLPFIPGSSKLLVIAKRNG